MARKIAAIVFSLGCIHSSSVLALGLGDITLESFLNEPLKAEVDLLNTSTLHEDQIRIRLATKEDFKNMGVDRAYFLTSIKFDVEIGGDGNGRILISSEDPVLEPFLDFIIEARWPSGRLLREYTVLVDPPLFDQSTPVISASEQVAIQEGLRAPAKKTQDPAVTETTGTRVDVRNSNLAPGEMPQRNFNADTVETPSAGERYMIHRDDTLWQIASRAKPAGVSVHQTMLDIQRLNPHAFIDGNINRIKAGYILYLPSGADISPIDEAAAIESVRQQNEDWQAGRASTPTYAAGPSLRISADEQSEADIDQMDQAAADTGYAGGDSPLPGEGEQDSQGEETVAGQLAAMERQLETLQRIVTLKDEQITALQSALAQAERNSNGTADEASMAAQQMPEEAEQVRPEPAAAPQVEEKPKPQPEVIASASEGSESAQEGGGVWSYLLYLLGAAALAALAFFYVRRRAEDDEDDDEYYATEEPVEAVFADVQLKEQSLDVQSTPTAQEQDQLGAAAEHAPAEEAPQENGTNGYGERRNDEYAADMEAGDAIAEADIYIAYGRYNQAVDLLSNAALVEPSNPAYQLKLLEIYLQTGDDPAVERTYAAIQDIGDAASTARAVDLMAGSSGEDSLQDLAADVAQQPEPSSLDAELQNLELEAAPAADVDEELELTPLAAPLEAAEENGEELMVASDSNGLSSKLDLARAYLDMGDEDGARQILEEITAEGSDELKAEASALLERIG